MSSPVGQRVGWLDCSSGVSGDMLLGALTELGAVEVTELARTLGVDATVTAGSTRRGGIRATRVEVRAAGDQPHRRLADIERIVTTAGLPGPVADRSTAVFRRLAEAEARVHGVLPHDVAFHEVGAVDAIVDIVGACIGLNALNLDMLVVGPVAVGGGRVSSAHGLLPVPGPAVLQLLTDAALVVHGGPVDRELATPTGIALLAEWATAAGPLPAMRVERVGIGAGGQEIGGHPNVLRLVVGDAPAAGGGSGNGNGGTWQVLAANVDDLDPRLWPVVIERLLAAGAADAWITPILMKKGRPAHTISVLCDEATTQAACRVLFEETSTIGVRSTAAAKHALERDWLTVTVAGQDVRVKVARLGGDVVNVAPEFDDVLRAATALGHPVKSVLAAATAAAHAQLP
jgi:uncharacterized protein (TIGR00299 family) protein